MNWLWPQLPREETTLQIRMGRVAHWFFVVGAVFAVAFGIFVSQNESDRGAVITAFVIFAFMSALLGRAVRYILADE